MAFLKENLSVARGTYNSIATKNSAAQHLYGSATDNKATILGAGYFPALLGATADEVKINDTLLISATDGQTSIVLTAVSPSITFTETTMTSTTINTTTDAASAYGAQAITLEIAESGDMVVISWSNATATPTQTADILISGLAGTWLPVLQAEGAITVFDNGIEVFGQCQVDLGGLMIFSNGASTSAPFTFPGGTVGLSRGSICYNKKI